MRPHYLVLISATLGLFCSSAKAISLSECGELYQSRKNLTSAQEALNCLKKLQSETRTTDTPAYRDATEHALQTTIWLYTQSAKDMRERYADEGLSLAKNAVEQLPQSDLGTYWLAVFHTMKCRSVDSGPIPRCFLKHKNTIIDLLNRAHEGEITVHGYGPSRILGVLYRELPRIVGGDIKLAKVLTGEALKSAPKFSTNILEHAKTLIELKEIRSARTMLEGFLRNACEILDATRIPECEVEKQEASEILTKLNRNK